MTSPTPFPDLPDRRRARQEPELEEPILSELFSVERLEQHAETLAAAQRVTDTPGRGTAVQPRIAENGRVLLDAYRILARGDQGRACDHPCGRVARRQLPDRRRADPRDPRRPPDRLLPRAAQARRWAIWPATPV